MKKLLLFFLLFLTLNWLFADRIVKVGVYPIPPMMICENNHYEGIAIDLLEQIALENYWHLEYHLSTLEELQSEEGCKLYDLYPVLGKNKEREAIFNFSQERMILNWGVIYAQPSANINSILDIDGKSIAIVKDSFLASEINDISKRFEIKFTPIYVHTHEEGVKLLDSGRVDATLLNRILGKSLEKKYKISETPVIFAPFDIYFAASKNSDPALLKTIDNSLIAYKKNKNSIYQKSLSKWLYQESFTKQTMSMIYLGLLALFLTTYYLVIIFRKLRNKTKQLQSTDKLLHTVFKAFPDKLMVINRNYEVIFDNGPSTKIFDLCHKHIFDSDMRCEHCRLKDVFEKKQSISFEKQDNDRLYKINMYPVFNEKKEVTLVIDHLIDITETKKTDSLKSFLAAIAGNSADGIIGLDAFGRITSFNRGAENMFGYKEQEMLGKGFSVLLQNPKLSTADTFEIKPQKNSKIVMFGKQEEELLVSISITDITDEQGKSWGYAAICRNITVEERLKSELIRREQLYEALLNTTDTGFIVFTPGGEILEANRILRSSLGIEESNINSAVSFYSYFGVGFAEKLTEALKECLEKGHMTGFESALFVDDHFLPIELNAMSVVTENGQVIVAMVKNISQRKQMEEKLCFLNRSLEEKVRLRTKKLKRMNRKLKQTLQELDSSYLRIKESEARYRTILEHFPNGVIALLDKQGTYLMIDGEKQIRANLEKSDIVGKTPKDVFFPEDYAALSPFLEDMMKGIKNEIDFKVDDEYFIIQFIPVFNDDGGVISGILMSQEVTNLKKSRDLLERKAHQLVEANRELESFSYSVSHDLRAPLRAIHGFTSILQEELKFADNDRLKIHFSYILENAARMQQLIDDLLAFSRIGRKSISLQKTDMGSLVEKVLASFKEQLVGVDLTVGKLPDIFCDASLITQVWQNLIGNALKYSSKAEDPKIEIGSYKDENGNSVFFVKDNGAGFDMQYVSKLFGVFQRLHSESEFPGTGVGLAICNKVVSKHLGKIWADAQVGKGASFYFYLSDKEA